jgi:hypothetical protein
MRRHSQPAANRPRLFIEQLEERFLPSGFTVVLDPSSDRTGNQIVNVQSYDDTARSAFSIFDTGSAAISFSQADQAAFTAMGSPIPIKVHGGAVAEGIGGRVTGDVSQPGTILIGGYAGSTDSAQDLSSRGGTSSGGSSGGSTGWQSQLAYRWENGPAGTVQAFIGTIQGSPHLPTLTGTPILYVDTNHPQGVAASVAFHGATVDLSSVSPGMFFSLPAIQYLATGTSVPALAGTSGFVTVPLTLRGIDNHLNPGNQVTQTPIPYQTSVGLTQGSAHVSGQNFLFDTGAQVSLISTATARALGFDLAHPEYTGTVGGVGGSIEVPGYTLDELNMPTADGGLLRFTHAPVYVLDVAGADGVLGTNLFNKAAQMLYDPFSRGGPSVSFSFYSGTAVGDGTTSAGLAILQQLDPQLAATVHGTEVPELGVFSGQINGEVFLDYNRDGQISATEPGLAGQQIYLDLNGTGRLDPGDPSTLTDSNGFFQFSNLMPGSYTVRQAVTSGLASVSATRAVGTVPVSNGTTTMVNFGVLPIEQDPLTAYIADFYGSILDRAPDATGYIAFLHVLENGGTRQQVAQAIWESAEHRGIQVDALYQNLLHRNADPAGRAAFVSLMLSGATEYDVERALITSAEYGATHSGNVSFLTGLYNDVLGRSIDPFGLSNFETALANGMSRDTVARLVITSLEHQLVDVDSYYQTLLHRQPQSAELQAWLPYLRQSHPTPDQVAEFFLTSDEFFAQSSQLASS